MFPFKKKKRERKPTPQWLMWLAIALILYAASGNYAKKNQPIATTDKQPAITQPEEPPALGSIIDPKKLVNVDALKGKIFPKKTTKLHVKDNSQGNGQYTVCGQNVTIKYHSFVEEKEIENSEKATFQIGSGQAMPALERGVLGMKINGTRTIYSPGDMAYGAEGFKRDDVPALADIRFEVEMLSASPELPEIGAYRVLGDGRGSGSVYSCGSQAKLQMSIWDMAGKKLYDSRNSSPVIFTIGKSEIFLGLEQGVLEMAPGMRRNLIVPPAFQKTLSGAKPEIDFPFPKDQIVLVDVEALQ